MTGDTRAETADDVAAEAGDWLGRHSALVECVYQVRRQVPRLPLLATSALNPRHPIQGAQLELVRDYIAGRTDETMPARGDIARRAGRLIFAAIRDAWMILRLKARFGFTVRRRRAKSADIVIKTWGFGDAAGRADADFYFGTISRDLDRQGIRHVIVCGNVSPSSEFDFAGAILKNRESRALPEMVLMPWWAPIAAAFMQISAAAALRRFVLKASDPVLKFVGIRAMRDVLTRYTLRNILPYFVFKRVVRAVRPRAIVTLFEGQPWEKPAWHGARAADPNCRIVGYQHTSIMPYARSLLAPNVRSWEIAAPDVLLCLGSESRKLLTPGYASLPTRFVSFGTHRRSSEPATRTAPEPSRRTVLVIPEGYVEEAPLLFNFALKCARVAPGHRFIFRCHPLLPFHAVRGMLETDPETIPNIVLSDQPIEADFQKSSVALYRGSSAAFYAILNGIKPVYVHIKGGIYIDPLFELTAWRDSVSSPNDMASLLNAYAAVSSERAKTEWENAYAYVNGYTAPVGDESIRRFLSAVGIAAAT